MTSTDIFSTERSERASFNNPYMWLAVLVALDAFLCLLFWNMGRYPGQFFKEGSYMSWYSFGQIILTGLVAFGVFLQRKKPIWALMALGFFFLAADEGFKIHEALDDLLMTTFALPDNSITDRLDDAIVGFYGLLGMGFLWLFRDELKRYRKALPLVIVAFVFMFLMVICDMLSNRLDFFLWVAGDFHEGRDMMSWFRAIEEVFKVFAEAFFIGAGLVCLWINGDEDEAAQTPGQ